MNQSRLPTLAGTPDGSSAAWPRQSTPARLRKEVGGASISARSTRRWDTAQEPDLVAIAESHGMTVVSTARWLHDGELGGWFPQHKRIHIRHRLGPANRRCTLAHEVGHAVLRHLAMPPPWLHERQERSAAGWAADYLITPSGYEEAERLVGSHEGALAKELNVTVEIIHAWRAHYVRAQAS